MHGLDAPMTVGDYGFDPETGELWRDGQVQRLRPQTARALATLVDRAGAMVTRDELQGAIWPDTRVEYDLGLNVCIRQLRQALGDDAESPRYIETLPRRGYRLVAPVSVAPVGDDESGSSEPIDRPKRRWGWGAALGVLVLTVGFWPRETRPATIAILPFRTIPAADSMRYLEDGLAEELITALAGSAPDRLTVIAPTSALTVAAQGGGAAAAGAVLGVDYVLEGALRPINGGYRVTVRLLETASGAYRWSNSYDLSARELLALDRTVADPVTIALAQQLGAPLSSPAATAPPDPATRDAVLRARFLLERFTRDDAQRALAIVQRRLTADSTSPGLFVEWARGHLQLGRIDSAESAIATARRFDPARPSVDGVAGEIALYGRHDAAGAVEFLERAVARAPGSAGYRRLLANALVASGRAAEAVEHGDRALDIDPVSSTVRGDIGWVYYYARRYDRSMTVCRSMLELLPESVTARQCAILAAVQVGAIERVSDLVADVLDMLSVPAGDRVAILADVNAGTASSLWQWLVATEDRRVAIGPVNGARVLALLGQTAEAAAVLRALSATNPGAMLFVAADPAFDGVQNEPDFRVAVASLSPGG